jgi:hypothetical protein
MMVVVHFHGQVLSMRWRIRCQAPESLSQLGDGEEEAGVVSVGRPRKTGRRREETRDT